MKTLNSGDAFTGLEAAIVLIAFVVVASVFAYVVLGAGFFTTQKAQETVHSGVQQTTSAVQPAGAVSVKSDDATSIANISFYLQLAAGGNAVDMAIYMVSLLFFNQLQLLPKTLSFVCVYPDTRKAFLQYIFEIRM
jgi:archaellin